MKEAHFPCVYAVMRACVSGATGLWKVFWQVSVKNSCRSWLWQPPFGPSASAPTISLSTSNMKGSSISCFFLDWASEVPLFLPVFSCWVDPVCVWEPTQVRVLEVSGESEFKRTAICSGCQCLFKPPAFLGAAALYKLSHVPQRTQALSTPGALAQPDQRGRPTQPPLGGGTAEMHSGYQGRKQGRMTAGQVGRRGSGKGRGPRWGAEDGRNPGWVPQLSYTGAQTENCVLGEQSLPRSAPKAARPRSLALVGWAP